MATLKGTELVEKRNVLNEIRRNNMGLQELRFFSIYLSKINARDITTRVVRFPISDFQRIMEIGRVNIQHLKQVTDSLLCKIVHIPNERGGYTSFQLFKECTVDQDENNVWYVEIDAHDKALPLMFEFKSHYFTYELWNALRLKSANQVRMYEILKQYEKIGRRELKVSELRELLGIEPEEYPRWDSFKLRVLDACQKALEETTDITYTYERGRAGRGGKWLTIVFYIRKNKNYVDQLTLSEFIEELRAKEEDTIAEPERERGQSVDVAEDVIEDESEYTEDFKNGLELLSEACDNKFAKVEIMGIFELICRLRFKSENEDIWTERYHYLRKMYIKLIIEETKRKGTKNEIKDRYRYLTAIIQNDIDKEEATILRRL